MPLHARPSAPDLVIAGVDLRDVSRCSCLRLRKASRRVTQIYEACLEPVGLTIGQFGVLATLQGHLAAGRPSLPIGVLADHLGVDPTTLKRTLGPLLTNQFVATHADTEDRRTRLVTLTETGAARLVEALPLWRRAQDALRTSLGQARHDALDRAVEEAFAALRTPAV